jgi:hypothetical protein
VATDSEQFAIINTRQWYTDMRTKAQTIIGAMQTNDFDVEGDDAWVGTQVDGIVVRFKIDDQDVHAQVAVTANGGYMYDWHFPIGWVTT